MAIYLDPAALQYEARLDRGDARMRIHESRDIGIATMPLFAAPAVEIEIDTAEIPLTVAHEYRAGIPDPQVVERARHQLDDIADEIARRAQVFFVDEHADRLETCDRQRDCRKIAPHFRQQVRAPDIFARPERHPGPRMRLGLIGHPPMYGIIARPVGSISSGTGLATCFLFTLITHEPVIIGTTTDQRQDRDRRHRFYETAS